MPPSQLQICGSQPAEIDLAGHRRSDRLCNATQCLQLRQSEQVVGNQYLACRGRMISNVLVEVGDELGKARGIGAAPK